MSNIDISLFETFLSLMLDEENNSKIEVEYTDKGLEISLVDSYDGQQYHISVVKQYEC